MSAAHDAVRELLTSLLDLVDSVEALDTADLACTSGHVCAYGGDNWQLVTNMIDHENEHAGQLAAARHHPPGIRTPAQRLVGEWMEARTRFATQLVGMSDDRFNRPMREGEWSYHEAVRHLVDLQKDVLGTLSQELATRAAPAANT
jgi:uncharacterized damage-inducible protein DinB